MDPLPRLATDTHPGDTCIDAPYAAMPDNFASVHATPAAMPAPDAAQLPALTVRVQSAHRAMSVSLLRAMSSLGRPDVPFQEPTDGTFRCHLCCADVIVSAAVTLVACGHQYCAACLQRYLERKITEGNVFPVCFHPVENSKSAIADGAPPTTTCGVAVNSDQIQQIVDPVTNERYQVGRFSEEHSFMRACPSCSVSQPCVGPENPRCVCLQCGRSFCFFHDNTHEHGTCADYELQYAQNESRARATPDETQKPCPTCHRKVKRNGAWNHVRCTGCYIRFCWLCGEAIIVPWLGVRSHYAKKSENGCCGKAFEGSERPVLDLFGVDTFDRAVDVFTILLFPAGCVLAVPFTALSLLCNRRRNVWELYKDTTLETTMLCSVGMFWLVILAFLVVLYLVWSVCAVIGFVYEELIEPHCRARRAPQPSGEQVEAPAQVVGDLEADLLVDARAPKTGND